MFTYNQLGQKGAESNVARSARAASQPSSSLPNVSSTRTSVQDSDEYAIMNLPPEVPINLSPPTLEQKKALLALPTASMAGSRSRSGMSKLVGKVFNPQAGRPYPRISSPDQSITVQLENYSLAFTSSTSVPVYLGKTFALSDFSYYTEYTGCFDQYQILQLEVWIEPALLMSSTVGSVPYYSAVDTDDGNTPSSGSQVSAKQGALFSETGTGHYHRWRPQVATALYSGAFTSYGSTPSQWIDSGSPSVQHFGLKVAVPGADGVARSFYITTRALVKFKAAGL